MKSLKNFSLFLLVLYLLAGCAKKPVTKTEPKPVSKIPCDTLLSGKIILNGRYQGQNLYVQNPFAGCGVGYCARKVLVNGRDVVTELHSSAFEIPLNKLGFKLGDSLNVEILHVGDCKPKVLNPNPHPRKSTFEIVSIGIDKDMTLVWKTKNEQGKFPFIVEQFRWNKWVKVGEVDGKGGPQLEVEAKERSAINEYSVKITPHSGKNQFRVKQVDYTGQPNISKTVEVDGGNAISECGPKKVDKEVTFTGETAYEVYDSHGNIVKKGFGKVIDCRNLPRGVYYLNYDNKMSEFIKL